MAVYNPRSQISLRILSRRDEPIDAAFIRGRVRRALDYRRRFADLNSCRLIFAESDGLPAVIADKFGDVIVRKFSALAWSGSRGISWTRWRRSFRRAASTSETTCPCASWRG